MKLEDLLPVALLFVVATIAISIGADIISSVQTGMVTGTAGCSAATNYTMCGYAYNTSGYGLEGMVELGSWVPTLALVVAASIVIGVLVFSFTFRR